MVVLFFNLELLEDLAAVFRRRTQENLKKMKQGVKNLLYIGIDLAL